MNTYRLSNISLTLFREYLVNIGCKRIAIEGGHEKWVLKGCIRPIIIQTHIDPIPEFILRNNLRTLHKTRKDFIEWLKTR